MAHYDRTTLAKMCQVGDFVRVGHFAAKFQVEGLLTFRAIIYGPLYGGMFFTT